MPTNLGFNQNSKQTNLGFNPSSFPLSARNSNGETNSKINFMNSGRGQMKEGPLPDIQLLSQRYHHKGNHQALTPLEPTKLLKSSRNHHQRLTLIDRENCGPRSPKKSLNNHQGILNIETHNHLLTNILESTDNFRNDSLF